MVETSSGARTNSKNRTNHLKGKNKNDIGNAESIEIIEYQHA